jgi:ABC-type Fe3+ transport system permease subunit
VIGARPQQGSGAGLLIAAVTDPPGHWTLAAGHELRPKEAVTWTRAARASRARRRARTRAHVDHWLGVQLLLPSLGFVGLSFHFVSSYDPTHPKFVGWENYVTLLWDETFWNDLLNGVVYTFGSIALQLALGLGIALFLNQDFVGRNLLRGIVLLPYLIPTVCAIFMARWMLDPVSGIVNAVLLRLTGLSVNWLGKAGPAMLTAMAVNTWRAVLGDVRGGSTADDLGIQ